MAPCLSMLMPFCSAHGHSRSAEPNRQDRKVDLYWPSTGPTLRTVKDYQQYCPIARGAEIFAERWTPLIIRNLFLGCATFTEILEGAPGLSRMLLSQRLKQLEWV